MTGPPAIVILTRSARPLAGRLADGLDGDVIAPAGDAAEAIRRAFRDGRPVVGLFSAGILIRSLAPLLADKTSEPPVVAVAEDGSVAVPLLGGHHGANALARRIAGLTGGIAAVTTASDVRLGIALDEPPSGYVLANPGDAKPFAARLIAGEPVRIDGEAPWLAALPQADHSRLAIAVTPQVVAGRPERLVYHPQTLALGVGCERGVDAEELARLAFDALASHGLAAQAVAGVFSLDLKADEPAVHALARRLGVPARFFAADRLKQEAFRLASPSAAVERAVGSPGVAEAAALAATGPQGRLIVPKARSARATCAIAEAPAPILDLPGRPRGRLAVVGIGPGSRDWLTPAAAAALDAAADWVGYGLYLDLVGHLSAGKSLHRFPLGAERERVREALALAAEGRSVALVSSGDAGIYAMAALVCEVIEQEPSPVAVEVIPGVSAFQAAAARAGALIGHDFCCISLSDLLTPWEVIETRVRAAAEADLVACFYNPRSARRPDHLHRALAILRPHRRPETPIVVATGLGRPDERVRVTPLGDFDPSEVDMLTVVLVGSSMSRAFTRRDGSTIAYTPRGYALKVAL